MIILRKLSNYCNCSVAIATNNEHVNMIEESKLEGFQQQQQQNFAGLLEHVNPAYDRYVTAHDKITKTESTGLLSNPLFYNKSVLDQWGVGVVRVCLFVIRDLKPEIWTNSFRPCNLDP
jgi:hypothetical protein